jgi:hypothetical protein
VLAGPVAAWRQPDPPSPQRRVGDSMPTSAEEQPYRHQSSAD